MNPQIILFKIFLLLSLGTIDKSDNQISLDNFVIQKQSTYHLNYTPSLSTNTLPDAPSGSIMHRVSYKKKLAIFCKMEHELMKASGFAVKFRLGDQSHVDQLEGK